MTSFLLRVLLYIPRKFIEGFVILVRYFERKIESRTVFKSSFFNTIIGFIVAGIFSAFITWALTEWQAVASREENLRHERIKIAEDLVGDMLARRVRAELLYSSFDRLAPDEEIKRRKRDYDEAYFNWNARSAIFLYKMEKFYSEDNREKFEKIKDHIDRVLIADMFLVIDTCLTKMYDLHLLFSEQDNYRQNFSSKFAHYDNLCKYKELQKNLRVCSDGITKGIIELAKEKSNWKIYEEQYAQKCEDKGYRHLLKEIKKSENDGKQDFFKKS